MTTRYALQPALHLSSAQQLGVRRYMKDVIRTGTWHVREPSTGKTVTLAVDHERLDRWANAYNRMRANGVAVDLTVDHTRGAEGKRGQVVSMERQGDVLTVTVETMTDEADKLIQQAPEVSVEIDGNVRDGAGNEYGEAITAVSVVRQPVVPGQQPFQRLAASRDGGGTLYAIRDEPVDRVELARRTSADLYGTRLPIPGWHLARHKTGLQTLQELLGDTSVTAENALAKIHKRVADLRKDLDDPLPPFNLNSDEIESIRELLFRVGGEDAGYSHRRDVKVNNLNWLEEVEALIKRLEEDVRLKPQRDAAERQKQKMMEEAQEEQNREKAKEERRRQQAMKEAERHAGEPIAASRTKVDGIAEATRTMSDLAYGTR